VTSLDPATGEEKKYFSEQGIQTKRLLILGWGEGGRENNSQFLAGGPEQEREG